MSNQAAWIPVPKARPYKVDSAPYPSPAPDEVIIKNAAVAINPVEWKVQDGILPYVENYPAIQGEDLAGEIVEVGSNVTGLTVGQRVIAHAHSLITQENKHAAFQLYVTVLAAAVAPIPPSISFAQGSVLPLAISTAAAGLYQPGFLELPFPSAVPIVPDKSKTLLVWGGSSSVGSVAVQLAVASGLTVFSTASPSNFEFVKSLGAEQVFDHYSEDVVRKIADALKGRELVGVYDSITLTDTIKKSAQVLNLVDGKKFIAAVLPLPTDLPDGIESKSLFALTIFYEHAHVGKAIWKDFVPEALKNGRLQPKPDPLVVGKGLEKIQDGVDKQKAGVSAKKVVVEL